jgi:hypothetical protein
MALYRLRCTGCPIEAARFADSPQDALKLPCVSCGKPMERTPTGLSAAVMETLDNGAMAKAVTRRADAERLYRERADASDPLAGRSIKHDD